MDVSDPSTYEGDTYGKFVISSPTEILFTLRSLMQHKEMVTASFGGGTQTLLTTLIDVRREEVILDYGAVESINRQILAAEKIIFISSLQKVRVQFTNRGLRKIEFAGRPAFSMPLPGELLKLQRRDAYRIATPVGKPLVAIIHEPGGKCTEARLTDLSVGGFGAEFSTTGSVLEAGMRYPRCDLTLPEVGIVACPVEIRHVEDQSKGALSRCHFGAQFLELPNASQVTLQRYITRLEVLRKK